jgi:hypothetical protein
MVRFGIAALAALMLLGPAQAADLSPTDIVKRHTSAGGNLDAIMADYADDAVVLQSGRAIQGKPAIRELFARMFPPRPAGAAPAVPPAAGAAPPAGGMNVSRVWEEGNVGFMTWSRGPMNATEEFIVRNGKIQVQVIFMAAAPAPTAKP